VIDATPEQLRDFIRALPRDEYYAQIEDATSAYQQRSMFNVIDLMAGWKIDLIIRKARPFSVEEFNRRQRVVLHGIPLFVARIEDSVISKLEWAKLAQSRRQIEDVAAILRARGNELDSTYLEKWIRELSLEKEWSEARLAAASE